MPNENQRRQGKSARSIEREEEKIWVAIYRKASDPALAADLVDHMDRDPEIKSRHPGLYLCCRQSLRREKMRRARVRVIAQIVHSAVGLLVLAPWRILTRAMHFATEVGFAVALPSAEPAVRQMRKIRQAGASSHKQPVSPEEKPAAPRQA